MRILIAADAARVAALAADRMAALISATPRAVIGLAAGASPLATYAALLGRGLDLSDLTVFGLDEYLGLGATHPQSCAHTLTQHFIKGAGIPGERAHLLDGLRTGDAEAMCREHERLIAQAGGLDLQILGIGVNGHMGFNEPGGALSGGTRVVTLRASTRATNRVLFAPDETPPAAVTMGVGTILSARSVLLLATGPAKAEAVARAAEGPITAMVPASALQLHPDATMIVDEAAAARLTLKADYLEEAALLANLCL